MIISARRFAIAIVCLGALLPVYPTRAATIAITGSPFGGDGVGSFAGYGTSISKNNVVNFIPSGLFDLDFRTPGSAWRLEGNTTPGVVRSNIPNYVVDWYFNGAESGYQNTLVTSSFSFSETNQNNRNQLFNDPGFSFVGTSSGSGGGAPIPFTVAANNGADVTNGDNNKPGEFIASLMFAYVKAHYNYAGLLIGWTVTSEPTDWFAFGFDDDGSKNDNHDDFMGVAHVRPVPLPGAALLFSSALGLLGLLRWKRKRQFAGA